MNRFLYLCGDPGIPVPGDKGASVHVECVLRALQQRGLEGELFVARKGGDSCASIPVQRLPAVEKDRSPSPEQRERKLFFSGLETPCPSADFDFVYERYSLWHAAGLRLAQAHDKPLILEVNSPLPEEASRFRSLEHQHLALGVAELVLRGAHTVVCVSDEVATWARRMRGRDEGVVVVPNGVDEERFAPERAERPVPLPQRHVPLVAFAGSFRPWHGLSDLAEAFARLVQHHRVPAHLVCVGDGPERESFAAQLGEQGLADRVHFTGKVQHADVARWIGAADVAVAPYPQDVHFYFSPLKLYEFMALGLPIVATNVGQISEVLGGGERGVLVPAGDPAAFGDAMAHLLQSPETARPLGATAREWVLQTATWKRRVDQILAQVER